MDKHNKIFLKSLKILNEIEKSDKKKDKKIIRELKKSGFKEGHFSLPTIKEKE